jgi:Zn-dependent peptidase ImmA (M78 family)
VTVLTDAEKLLQDLGITEPEEIDLEAIAWHLGAIVKYRVLDGCEAKLVGTKDRAIITINASSIFTRQRFSLGHEIGHWRYHRDRILVCQSDDIIGHDSTGARLERQANSFAGDLLLPSYILAPYISEFKTLSFDVIWRVAKKFDTSRPATAIRLVEKGKWPSMLICHGQNGRKWFTKNPLVPSTWFPREDLDPDSRAFGLVFGNEPNQTRPSKVSARAWFDRRDAERYEIEEQSVHMPDGEVLSLLLITNIKMLEEKTQHSGYRFR